MELLFSIDLRPIIPELLLVGGILLLLVIDLIVKRNNGKVAGIVSVLLLAVYILLTLTTKTDGGLVVFGAIVSDGMLTFFRLFFAVAVFFSITLLSYSYPKDGEPYFLMLSSLIGMSFLAASADIITLFVALELVSIPSYVLAGFKRRDAKSAEAALKYVIYGSVATGLMLYGFSLLYGLSGTTKIAEMAMFFSENSPSNGVQFVGILMILVGIGYKIAMVPLHFWCPDVYEGSPTAVTAFFSVAPKAAGFAALIRLVPLFDTVMPFSGISIVTLISFVSMLTMSLGNLGAIWQESLKRLLAYSSIAHAGYMLMGIAVIVGQDDPTIVRYGMEALILYLIVYLFMNFGAFWVIDMVERAYGSDNIKKFKGLGKHHSLPALALTVFLFSLVGLPPLAGFVGKFYLFASVVKANLWALAIVGIANTVVSLFYYVKIIKGMFLEESTLALDEVKTDAMRIHGRGSVILILAVVPTIILGIWWNFLVEWIRNIL